jgi:acyl-CoA synthetase (AMP-forming)/AMP-acid ligase II
VTTGELLIGDVFRNAAAAVPNRAAVILGEETLTFSQLDESANRLGRVLTELGLKAGSRLAVWSNTRVTLAPLFAAASKLGLVYTPINATLGADEAEEVVRASKATLLVTDELRWESAVGFTARIGIPASNLDDLRARSLAKSSSELQAPGLSERDAHVLFFTSGTSGRPKGALISHRVNFLRTHPGALLERRGPMVCPYPLFHMAAFTIALQQWQARDAVVLLPSADPVLICRAIERHRATRVNCVPAIWRRILAHLEESRDDPPDLSSLLFADTGTSATPPELLAAITDACPGAQVRVFYGSTEAGSVASLDHADIDRKPGSCGVRAPSTEVQIAPDGELRVRGPLLFDGYFDDLVATEAALHDGWYHTGDLAEMDDEGYLTITGRVGEVIRTGGESVSPSEVETALLEHPSVSEVAIIGLPDAQWGEVVCAAVVPARRSKAPTVDEFREFLKGRLATFKQPRRVVVVDRIPRTASTLQVQRRLLVEQVLERD